MGGVLAACRTDQPTSAAEPRTTEQPVASASLVAFTYPTSAQGVTPAPIAGNTTEASCPVGTTGYKLDGPQGSGTVPGIPGITFTIDAGKQFLSWSTSGLYVMRTVFIKGGDDSYRYDYNPPTLSADQKLAAPRVGDGNIPQISHFVYCYEQIQPAQVSGTKYHDLDADGAIDAGEPGLAGWTFYVDYNANSALDAGEPSATSGAGGAWSITGINPGTWTIRELSQTGWACSFPTSDCTYSSTLVSGGSSAGNSFANWARGSIGGTKFHDLNNSGGARNVGEPGLAGFEFHLFRDLDGDGALSASDGASIATTTSAAGGSFTFAELTPGKYLVCEVVSSGWILSMPSNLICAASATYYPSGYAATVTSNSTTLLGAAANGYAAGQSSFGNTAELFGCTPGYWKNHTNRWPAPYTSGTPLTAVFGNQALAGTLLEGLSFGGGGGTDGAKRTLLRAAVASLLNFAHPDVAYAVPAYNGLPTIESQQGMNDAVVAALAGSRSAMLGLAAQLDAANNAVNSCPLSGTRAYKAS